MIEVIAVPDTFAFDPERTALVVIDMQRDFIEPGGFGAALGNDVTPLAAIIPAVQQLLDIARQAGLLVIL
ncbi:MAG TPA: cysteine hydrolase, partial [Pseudomonas sp.]|nr:cysteine hydrolase [Pseudomonas sp.]